MPGELTPKERVGRGLDLLAAGLRPFVDQYMGAAHPGKDWLGLLEARDEQRTGQAKRHSRRSPTRCDTSRRSATASPPTS